MERSTMPQARQGHGRVRGAAVILLGGESGFEVWQWLC